MNKAVKEFLREYRVAPQDKIAVQTIGPQVKNYHQCNAPLSFCFIPAKLTQLTQVSLWPTKLKEFSEEHLYYFFNQEDVSGVWINIVSWLDKIFKIIQSIQGVLDSKGRKVDDCKVECFCRYHFIELLKCTHTVCKFTLKCKCTQSR